MLLLWLMSLYLGSVGTSCDDKFPSLQKSKTELKRSNINIIENGWKLQVRSGSVLIVDTIGLKAVAHFTRLG